MAGFVVIQVSSMDVSHEDTIREAPRELMLLIPFIFVVQVRGCAPI